MIWKLLLTPFVFAVNSICVRAFQKRYQNSPSALWLFESAFCLVAGIAFFTMHRGCPDGAEIGLATAFGVLFFVVVAASSHCYEIGPMSLTAVLINASLLLPVLWSCITLREIPGIREWIGIAVLTVTFVLSARKEKTESRMNLRWWLFLLPAFFANGATAILQKYQQLHETEDTGGWFLSIAYLTACLCFLLFFCLQRKKEHGAKLLARGDAFLPFLTLFAGLGSFGGNGLLQSLCTQVSSGVLYPIVNGGLCVITAAASFLLFREPVGLRKAAAILTGVAGIVILTL